MKILLGLNLSLLLLWSQLAVAGSSISGAKDGVAVQGFDVVAYFIGAKAVKGSSGLTHDWAGTVWFFSTAENRDAFAAQPEKYAPQYGGHCALSIAFGKIVKGSGEAWYLDGNKLYLNANIRVRDTWLREMSKNIMLADREWPPIKARLEAE